MKKLIILVQPKHGPWDSMFCRIPEALLAIAAKPFKEGYDIKIIDQRINSRWKEDLAKYAKETPICVGITSLTGPSLEFALESAKLVKEINPKIPVVFGGFHATLLPEQSLKSKYIDIIIKGEGDYTFFDIIKALENNESLDLVSGVYYKKNGKVKYTGDRKIITDMDLLDESPYEIFDLAKYNAVNLGGRKSISFQTARGCPMSCKFCSNPAMHKSVWRHMSVENVIKKIVSLQKKYGYDTFLFLDDCTSIGISHFRELLNGLNSLEKKILWGSVGLRADLIVRMNDDDLKLLWKSGCRGLDIGVESGSDIILKKINKGETKETIEKANRMLAKYDIVIKYTFVIGFPNETEEQINETIDFYLKLSKENKNAYPNIYIYTPMPGTGLYEESLNAGFRQPKTIKEWINLDFKTWLYKYPNWIPKNKRREREVISIASLFCNSNTKNRLITPLSRFAYIVYHPIAKFRFDKKYFGFPFETIISKYIFK